MTTQTITTQRSEAGIMPALLALALGIGLITITGVLQSTVLHDAAHDVRHATGFPCH
jgi:cobalt transporter subunit CbtB